MSRHQPIKVALRPSKSGLGAPVHPATGAIATRCRAAAAAAAVKAAAAAAAAAFRLYCSTAARKTTDSRGFIDRMRIVAASKISIRFICF